MIQAHYLLHETIAATLLAGAALALTGVTLILRHQWVWGE
jgi:drug/metabolite transporter (DMT)-like permease